MLTFFEVCLLAVSSLASVATARFRVHVDHGTCTIMEVTRTIEATSSRPRTLESTVMASHDQAP